MFENSYKLCNTMNCKVFLQTMFMSYVKIEYWLWQSADWLTDYYITSEYQILM